VLAKASAPSLPVELALLPGFDTLPAFEETLQHSPKMRQQALHYSRHGEGWSSPMTRGWSCLLSTARPGFIPRGTLGRRRQIRKELKNCWTRCATKQIRSRCVFRLRDCTGETRASHGHRHGSRDGEILERARSGGFGYDPVFYFRRLRKHLRSFPPKKKSAQPSRESFPQIARGSLLHAIVLAPMPTKSKKKPSRKKQPAPAKSKAANPRKQPSLPSPLVQRNGSEARSGNPRETGRSVREATCELKHENAFQLLISTILSAQCTDVRVNQVAETLYKKYRIRRRSVRHARRVGTGHPAYGFFRNKTKSVMGASKAIIDKFGGQVPRTMEEILTLRVSPEKRRTSCSARRMGSPAEWSWIRMCCVFRTVWICREMKIQEGRAGFDEDHSAGEVDPVFPPTDLHGAGLPCAKTGMHRVQYGIAVLRERQNDLKFKDRRNRLVDEFTRSTSSVVSYRSYGPKPVWNHRQIIEPNAGRIKRWHCRLPAQAMMGVSPAPVEGYPCDP